MKSLALLSACLFVLAACADTVTETSGTFTTDRGTTYPTTTRQFQRPDGSTYSRMTIRVGAERVSCIPDDRDDCEAALRDTFSRDRSR